MKFIPRSAVYGRSPVDEEGHPIQSQRQPRLPMARPAGLRAGPPMDAAHQAMPVLHQVGVLKAQLTKVHNDRARIVKEANAKLGALVQRVRQLEGFVRTSYAPGAQVAGGSGPGYDVAVPTHALRNPNLYTVDGAKGAPPAQVSRTPAGNPHDAAGNPQDRAHDVHETVRAAEDAIFYGSGDSAFYEGGEND